MFRQVVNNRGQQRIIVESIFQSQQAPKHIGKLQETRRIIGKVLEKICQDNFQEAETLIETLPSRSLKRQSKTIIQKIRMLNRRVDNIRTSKEENQRIAKKWSEEADRLKDQLEENNRLTILRNLNYENIIRRDKFDQSENENLKKINADLHRQYDLLCVQKDKLNIEKEVLISKCELNEQKIIKLEQQVIKMQNQNHELKLRLNQNMPILQEGLQSSNISSQPSRPLLRRQFQVRQANQQIQINDPHINQFVLGPGQRWQLQSVTISIKESIPSQAELIEYCFIVKIQKKAKSEVNEQEKRERKKSA